MKKNTEYNFDIFIDIIEMFNETSIYYPLLIELKNRLKFCLIISFCCYKFILEHEEHLILILLNPILDTIDTCEYTIKFSFNHVKDLQRISKIISTHFTIICLIPIILYQFWLFIKPAYTKLKIKTIKKTIVFFIVYYFYILYLFYTNIIYDYAEECLNQISFLIKLEKLTSLSQTLELQKSFFFNLTLTNYIIDIEQIWIYYITINLIFLIIIFLNLKIFFSTNITTNIIIYTYLFFLINEIYIHYGFYTNITILTQKFYHFLFFYIFYFFKKTLYEEYNKRLLRKTGFEPA